MFYGILSFIGLTEGKIVSSKRKNWRRVLQVQKLKITKFKRNNKLKNKMVDYFYLNYTFCVSYESFSVGILYTRIMQYRSYVILINCQTWVNNHLRIATICLQRLPLWSHISNFHNIKLPLNNDHLSTTAIHLGSRRWLWYKGFSELIAVVKFFCWQSFHNCCYHYQPSHLKVPDIHRSGLIFRLAPKSSSWVVNLAKKRKQVFILACLCHTNNHWFFSQHNGTVK